MAEFVKVAKSSDIAPGEGKMVQVKGQNIALFNVDGSFYAIDNACTHQGGPLSEGILEGTTVTCPWHRAKFDVTAGTNLTPPAYAPVKGYSIRVVGTDLEIEL